MFRDKDFVETTDGIFFCVVGDVHSEDRIIAYPRYAPGQGLWRRGNTSYSRLLKTYSMQELLDAIEYLKTIDRAYTSVDPHIGVEMSCIPMTKMRRYYSCRERLRDIMVNGARDELEKRAMDLAALLSHGSGVKQEFFGLSGSVLVGVHHTHSDIDMVVYGKDNFWALEQAMEEELKSSRLERQIGQLVENWLKTATEKYPLKSEELKKLYERIKTRARFGGTPFSVHGVRKDDEISEEYGDRYYESAGTSRITCNIVNDSESCFNPAIYKVETLKADSRDAREVVELASYDGTFASIFRTGDNIEAFGKIERVLSGQRRLLYHRLLIGSFQASGKEFVKLL